ncbi:hypothetical protein CCMSSC00406_0007564 [Pleurotus cornucopiae]|uniref:Uncharacterized protein n=1 Tax=Pleurotus cornucopiae TaxID=5321 RepID=A0ACB7J5E6_PLECO|nr:hypothetical protein CCMSSC00406_0007564 [Pleurotus cornucopiae]
MSSAKHVRSVYTPVFYLTPDPSSASSKPFLSEPRAVMSYLNTLSRQHVALAQNVKEVPSSRPSSPELELYLGPDAEKETSGLSEAQLRRVQRVEDLRSRVVDAFRKAKGEPGEGKWTQISQMLRMGCTAGRYRWIRGCAPSGRQIREMDPSLVLPETEEEWHAMERKFEQKQQLKQKVEIWQEGVAPVEEQSQETQASESQNEPAHSKADTTLQRKSSSKSTVTSLSKQGSLQFKVAKRASGVVTSEKPHDPTTPNDGPLPHEKPALQLDSSPMPVDDEGRGIADISDAFLPPSFPSQLQTSTPRRERSKVPLIDPAPGLDVSLTSAKDITPNFFSQEYNRRSFLNAPEGQDDPQLPSSPRHPPPSSHQIPSSSLQPLTSSPSLPSTPIKPNSKKRRLDATPKEAGTFKKVKTTSMIPEDGEPPTTPPRAKVSPRITTTNVQMEGDIVDWTKAVVSGVLTTPERKDKNHIPTLTEILASKKRSSPNTPKKRSSGVYSSPSQAKAKTPATKPKEAQPIVDADLQTEANDIPQVPPDQEQAADVSIVTMSNAPLDVSDITLDKAALNLDVKSLYDALDASYHIGYDIDMSSPAKSLSSIAGSDSEDSDEEAGDALRDTTFINAAKGFEPLGASTQADGGGGFAFGGMSQASVGGGIRSFGMYNSQFDVEGEVDRVSELLERDVDFDGWLRDASIKDDAEEEEGDDM